MAVYTSPNEVHEHYVERDTGSGSAVWAVIAVLIVLFLILFFGTNVFGNRNSGSTGGTNNTPSGTTNGSIEGSASGSYSP